MGKKMNKLYRAYYEMHETLKDDYTFNYYKDGMSRADNGEDNHNGETYSRYIDMDWVEAIEYALPYIQNAVDEMRRTIKTEEEIVNVQKIKKVSPDTVKHLASHANYIAKIDDHGDVVPDKLLNVRREDTFNIYENRMLHTLLNNISRFISSRFAKLKETPEDSIYETHMHRDIDYHGQKIEFSFDFRDENHEVDKFDIDDDIENLSDFARVARIRQITQGILNSQLMQELKGCEEVRSPLTMTNLLKKNPNFKEAVQLWTFLEKYQKPGFVVEKNEFDGEMSKEIKDEIYGLMSYNRFVMDIAQNPGLKQALHEKYLEEVAEETRKAADPDAEMRKAFEQKVRAIREEEMNLRIKEVREREAEIHKLKATVAQLNMTLQLREQQIVELTNKLNAAYDEIEALKQKIMALEDRIKELQEEIERLLAIIEEQKREIEELKAEVARLTEELEQARAEIKRLLELEQQLRAEIASLKNEIARLNGIIEKLKADIAERDAIIADQKQQIANLNSEITSLNNQIENERKHHAQEVATINANHKNEIDKMVLNHNNEIKSINDKHTAEVNIINTKHDQEVQGLQSAHKTEIDRINTENLNKIDSMNKDFQRKMSAKDDEHQKALAKQQKSFENDKEALKKVNEKQQRLFDAKIEVLKDDQEKELRKVNDSHAKELEKLHRDTADSLAKERKRHDS
ncbi:MAG: hypothetical protein SO152_08435, partial [Ruminococcus sp.]|nr:hypothetical protein [Ruminococcus sp.]